MEELDSYKSDFPENFESSIQKILFTLKRVSLVSAEDGDLHLFALEARDAPFGAALVADLDSSRFSSFFIKILFKYTFGQKTLVKGCVRESQF